MMYTTHDFRGRIRNIETGLNGNTGMRYDWDPMYSPILKHDVEIERAKERESHEYTVRNMTQAELDALPELFAKDTYWKRNWKKGWKKK